ncbi:MAG: hypothetical protein M1383_04560 [Patescibacteria group bacterium]|nr:hypothetical protein [Patescibacteria group bacterium]
MVAAAQITQFSALVQNFNWHTPSWDLFIFLAWAVGSVIYAFAAGRGRIISLLISLYIAKLMVLEAPWLANAINQKLPSSLSSLQQLVSFLLIFLLLFMLLGRYAFRTSADGRHFGSIPFSVVFAVLQLGLLINTVLTYLSAGLKQSFSPLVQFVFLGATANFVWLVAPLVFLIILGRSVADPTEV